MWLRAFRSGLFADLEKFAMLYLEARSFAISCTIAGWFGVRGYPPAVLFAVGLLFVIMVLLHYSTVISRLADQNTILAQRIALLEARMREHE